MFFRNRSLIAQRGMSLVAVMVAVGLMGILGVAMAEAFKNSLAVALSISEKSSLEDLRQYVRIGMDCANTVAAVPTNCPDKKRIAFKRHGAAAADLIQTPTGRNATTIGKFKLMAYCTAAANTFNVSYSNATVSWTALFDIPIVCP